LTESNRRHDTMRILRPKGSPVEVADLEAKWQRLWDLDCGHDEECDEFLERNRAVDDASQRVSAFQEARVFHRLAHERRGEARGPLDTMVGRLARGRWPR
jgi:hypothetical protein